MTSRTKEEQQLLDEKIARIQKKNEEILRRQKEIDEDKRLAEQQNAIVKLRPSTANVSRERTPALKPSKRDLREDFSDDFEEPVIQRNTRGSFRSRGGERYRGQGDWKANGPPPDPKSFLYDDERDGPPRDGKGDLRRELDRKRSDERDNREETRGGREFQRGGRRGGNEYRTERGRRGSGRGRGGRNDEEAWRAERLRIDEARIQRQKSADGKWRREWDSEKIMQEPNEEPRYESRRSSNQDQWHSPHQHHHNHPHHHHHHQCHGGHHHHSPHECPHHPQPASRGRGRGRGRLDLTELEMPLDNIQIDFIQQKTSPRTSLDIGSIDEATHEQGQQNVKETPLHTGSLTHSDDFKFSGARSIECVGNTVKISIPNTNVSHSVPKGQRRPNEARGRFRSQGSYSSQSDEDSPGQRGGRRQRIQKYPKSQEKLPTPQHDKSPNISENTAVDHLTAQNKPPLPPLKFNHKTLSSAEDKEGDESWEDVTTSGAESTGEELVSGIPNMTIMNSAIRGEADIVTRMPDPDVLEIEPSDGSFNQYLDEIGVLSVSESLTNTEVVTASPLDSQTMIGMEPLQLNVMETVDSKTEKVMLNKDLNDIGSVVDLKGLETFLEASCSTINLATTSTVIGISSVKIENMQHDDHGCILNSQSVNAKAENDVEEKNLHVENATLDKREEVAAEEPEKLELSSKDTCSTYINLKSNTGLSDETKLIDNDKPCSDVQTQK